MKFVKINEDGLLENTFARESQTSLIERLTEDGFKPHIINPCPTTTLDELQGYTQVHTEEDGYIVTRWEVCDFIPDKVQNKIKSLCALLASTDYQVIKNEELLAAGQEPCYDPQSLYESREQIREQIRELEAYL